MIKPYKTLLNSSCEEYIINKSRFIAFAAHIESVEEALNAIKIQSERYPDATHHCYAYIIDENGSNSRFSDDGEPSGTAGLPILNVLKKRELCHSVIVVTRYFGGILLGAGGLVRAYTHSAAIAVEAAGIGISFPGMLLRLTLPYAQYDFIRYHLSQPDMSFVHITDTVFEQNVVLTLQIRQMDLKQLEERLGALLNGAPRLSCISKQNILWQE